MPRSISQTSPALTLCILRFHAIEKREAFRCSVLRGSHFLNFIDRERPAA